MKQIYYVNGKRVDFSAYAAASGAEFMREEELKKLEAQVEGFQSFLNEHPEVQDRINRAAAEVLSVDLIPIEFDKWRKSDEGKAFTEKYERRRRNKAIAILSVIGLAIVLFILRASGVI